MPGLTSYPTKSTVIGSLLGQSSLESHLPNAGGLTLCNRHFWARNTGADARFQHVNASVHVGSHFIVLPPLHARHSPATLAQPMTSLALPAYACSSAQHSISTKASNGFCLTAIVVQLGLWPVNISA